MVTDRFTSLAATLFSSPPPRFHTAHYYLTAFILTHEDDHRTEKKAEKERELEKKDSGVDGTGGGENDLRVGVKMGKQSRGGWR